MNEFDLRFKCRYGCNLSYSRPEGEQNHVRKKHADIHVKRTKGLREWVKKGQKADLTKLEKIRSLIIKNNSMDTAALIEMIASTPSKNSQ